MAVNLSVNLTGKSDYAAQIRANIASRRVKNPIGIILDTKVKS